MVGLLFAKLLIRMLLQHLSDFIKPKLKGRNKFYE